MSSSSSSEESNGRATAFFFLFFLVRTGLESELVDDLRRFLILWSFFEDFELLSSFPDFPDAEGLFLSLALDDLAFLLSSFFDAVDFEFFGLFEIFSVSSGSSRAFDFDDLVDCCLSLSLDLDFLPLFKSSSLTAVNKSGKLVAAAGLSVKGATGSS